MKKIKLIPLLLFFILVSSCQKDDSLDPRPVLVEGSFMKLDITHKRFNIDDLSNTTFGGMLTNPGGKVVKYNLYVRRTDTDTNQAGEFVLLRTITSFPLDLEITPQEIATHIGLPITSLKAGDTFRFIGEAFDANNTRTDYYNLSSTIQSNPESYKQAFRFGCIMGNNSTIHDLVIPNYDPQ
jgi:hypothetical protein